MANGTNQHRYCWKWTPATKNKRRCTLGILLIDVQCQDTEKMRREKNI